MILHCSNRTEELVGVLARLAATPPADAVLPECIVVQGRGMERWLSMQLAERLGVWANPEFPFPRSLIERVLATVLGPAPPAGASFDPEALLWSIARVLPERIDTPGFESIRRFLADDTTGARRVQLSQRIAATFDHYLIYRPEMIRAWEEGSGDDWQPILWRHLCDRHGSEHLANRARTFVARLRSAQRSGTSLDADALAGLPSRVSFFGVSAIPPLYVDVLAALSAFREVHLFVVSASRSVPGESGRTSGEGNPLGASLGRVGRELQQILRDRGDLAETGEDLYRDDHPKTMLGVLQADVLAARRRRPGGDPAPSPRTPGDRSIGVHACPGPMREVEVLHDRLVEAFERDPTLEPRDVIVMTPDIEAYAPFVEAVFAGSGGAVRASAGSGATMDRPRVPYRIADRKVRATHEVVDALFALLEVLSGRMTGPAVLDLLLVDRIRARFGIGPADLDEVAAWIRGAGVRWGVDAGHRGDFGQPELGQNTWREGLERLFLGYAMPADGRELFADRLPAADVDVGRAALLGQVADFCETLFAFRRRLEGPRALRQWSRDLGDLLEAMVERADETARQHDLVRRALGDLVQAAEAADFAEPVCLATVRIQLDRALQRGTPASGFLSGGVTFCEMVPMRSIPFRVVALLGMNDDAFPRRREPSSFDLAAGEQRLGDRSAREDDRYLFLEALLSARETLLVTYVGQSVRDGTARPPSIVVSELLDHMAESFAVPEAMRDRLQTHHPLQAFSPRNFDGSDPDLWSYAGGERAAAEAMLDARSGSRVGTPYVVREIEPEDARGSFATPAPVDLAELVRFFVHPVRFFLQRRLGLYLGAEAPYVEDREPMELDGLERWKIGDALLEHRRAGLDEQASLALVRAEGALPPGVPGELEAEQAGLRVAALVRELAELQPGDALPDRSVDAIVGRWRVVGRIDQLWTTGRVVHQYSKLPHRRELELWIHHLVLNLAAIPGVSPVSHLVAPGSDGVAVLRISPLGDAEPLLCELLELYELGQRVPLPLFPRGSRTYAAKALQKGWPDVVRPRVEDWDSPRMLGSEAEEAYIHQAFRNVDPLSSDTALPGGISFVEMTRRVYAPYLRERQELR